MSHLDVDKLLAESPNQFESVPFYSEDGDSLQFYHENVDYHAERIDCWLTVYKAFEDERLIGFKIKNVKVLLSRFDALGLDCRVSQTQWAIRLQPLIAYIPLAFTNPAPQYADVLTSFAHQLHDPVDVACAPA